MYLKFFIAFSLMFSSHVLIFILFIIVIKVIIVIVIIIVIGHLGRSFNCLLFVWVANEFAFVNLNGVLLVIARDVGHGAQRMPMPILECDLEVDIYLDWNNREIGRVRWSTHLHEQILAHVNFSELCNA